MAVSIIQRMRRAFRYLRRAEDGSASIEFVIIFPVVMSLVLMAVEMGVYMTRSLMLDRAIDVSMRSLRLGDLTPMTHDGLKDSICENSLIIPNCAQSLSVELAPLDLINDNPKNRAFICRDKSDTVAPVLEFQAGATNQLMLVSACATFQPFFPTTGLAATIKLNGAGEYAMVATSAYVNEP